MLFCPLKNAQLRYFSGYDIADIQVLYLHQRNQPFLSLKHVLEFNKEENQLTRLEFLPGNQGKLLVYAQDFRQVEGMWLPHEIRWEHPASHFKAVMQIEKYEFPKKFPAKAFSLKPKEDREVKELLEE